ncbi:MAG: TrkH family potassium uptake protein [Muribaculaceae bacterium]|nr:TrkH family potassium uptake protein [Muribaculaceae bacterium]
MLYKRAQINFPALTRIVGLLLLIESIFMLIPLITCLVYNENDYKAFLITILITSVVGGVMTIATRSSDKDMGKREGFLLTALTWVVFSIFGMLPFMLGDSKMSISDAFFEAMSGFTTTGATVMTSIDHLSNGIHMWRCLMQWIGGMGIILFTLAVIPMLNHSGGMQMFNAEVTGVTRDKLSPRISQTAKGLWLVYIILTFILCVLLWLGPMNLFDSICHAFSTMSTGGFSTRTESIGAWDTVYVKSVLTLFMFLGGVNFALLFRAATGHVGDLWKSEVFRAYVIIVGVMLGLFVVAIVANNQVLSWESVTIDPLFQIVSTITSTGLTIGDFENWGPFVVALTFMLMMFGACAGSTSGGAKIDRMLFLMKNIRNEIYRSLHPNAICSVRINGKVLSADVVNKVIAFLCIYVILILVGGIVLTATGIPLVDAFFSAFSCIGNTGLGAGVTGYGGSYDIIPDVGKWVLSLLMLMGRLELFTVLLLFTRTFWKK